jgi:hypothetical protein
MVGDDSAAELTEVNQGARHSCEQGDELAGYTWTKHDGRTAGSQIIRDPLNNVVLTTEFLKVPGGERGVCLLLLLHV